MGLFLKNSEVKDNFKAKGLKEAGDALDIMRLPRDDEYSYNRYLDYLHYKASEAFSLRLEAEDNVRIDERQKRDVQIIQNAINEGFDDDLIVKLTKLSIEQVQEIRKNTKKI